MVMKKQKRQARNLVAKHAQRFQHSRLFRDRTKYQRHAKHKGDEPYTVLVENSRECLGFDLRTL